MSHPLKGRHLLFTMVWHDTMVGDKEKATGSALISIQPTILILTHQHSCYTSKSVDWV
jgi:hypothetical protein